MNIRDRTAFKPFVANSQSDTALFAISIPANEREMRSLQMDGNTTYPIIKKIDTSDRANRKKLLTLNFSMTGSGFNQYLLQQNSHQ